MLVPGLDLTEVVFEKLLDHSGALLLRPVAVMVFHNVKCKRTLHCILCLPGSNNELKSILERNSHLAQLLFCVSLCPCELSGVRHLY